MNKNLFLSLAVILTTSTVFAKEYTCPDDTEILKCWKCGVNCILTLDTSTGHAVVEGEGNMETKNVSGVTNANAWGNYRKSFQSVEIKSGITSIGDGAFQATSLQNVIIPDTVTKIGAQAFYASSKLQNINIPDSVTSIGSWGLASTDIKNLIIPDSVKELGYSALNALSLQTLTIPDTLSLQKIQGVGNMGGTISATFSTNIKNVICAGGGDTEKCNAVLKQGGKEIQSISKPNYLLNENGDIIGRYIYDKQGNLTQFTLQKGDGSVYTYDKDGKILMIRGKKIYTIDEAVAVIHNSPKNTFSIRYR